MEGPGDGSIILRWIFTKQNGGVDWIDMDQERDKVRAVVSTVMNLQFQLCTTQGISCVPEERLASFDSASYGQLVRKVHVCIR
jgi:hypothetical protein